MNLTEEKYAEIKLKELIKFIEKFFPSQKHYRT